MVGTFTIYYSEPRTPSESDLRLIEAAGHIAVIAVGLYQVPELVPDEVLEKSGAKAARSAFAHVPIASVAKLAEPDGLIFGTPTRFGNMCGQMRNFLDQAGGLRAQGKFIAKVGRVFASTGTQHGGQETTITSFHTTLIHLGMVVVGVPWKNDLVPNSTSMESSIRWFNGTRESL